MSYLKSSLLQSRLKLPVVAVIFTMLNFPVETYAAETGHYPNGTSGIKGGTLPPPGLYYLMYNLFYSADDLQDKDGNSQPIGFKADVFVNNHRLIHVTEKKLWGADIAWNISIPFVHSEIKIKAAGIDENETKLGDIFIEPFVMEWHEPQWDLGWNYGLAIPTGDRDDDNPALPGKEFWTHYLGFAGTWFPDKEKKWSASVLGRYETHTKRKGIDITAGDAFSFEWGVGKNIGLWEVGFSGYASWQVTDDSGKDVTYPKTRDRIFGIGPELHYFFPSYGFGIQFRHWSEFGARDRSEGQITTLTLVIPFSY